MNSKNDLKTITVTNSKHEKVLLEGTLGELVCVSIENEGLLVVSGSDGILRLAIDNSEFLSVLNNDSDSISIQSTQKVDEK